MDGGPEDPIRRRRARRARQRAAALGAAALAVAAVAGIVASVRLLGPGGEAPSPAPPVASPTVSADAPSTRAVDLRGTVDADDAGLLDIATTPGAPDQRIAIWCGRDEQHWILALTADGFAHRRLREVTAGTEATPLGEGRFVLRDGWEGRELSIVDVADGRATPVRVARTQAPVAAGEVPVVLLDGASTTLAAVAPDGSGHEVPVPDGVRGLAAYGGRLTAVDTHGDAVTRHWSDDGGATWQQSELPGTFLPWIADAGAGAPHVVLEGGDGATLFPLLAVDTARAADPTAWTRDEVDRDTEWPTVSGAWIDRKGGLRVLATIERQGARGPVDAGVWQVAGGRLTKVATDVADLADLAEAGILAIEYDGGPVLWVGAADGTAWRSSDDGVTWERFAAR
ncbi:hypothetical protein [Nocardioides sp. SLBN-35]|uniref:hypothetical protein n=1 Tax=Nocardioides sp. SLBN-35 TaxID=2768445 RepID=UPI001154B912|nr:hypothetical protein [Nocardioides sp. SLBN-35]TQK72364.1 hypothetical protein FBY23_4175 [Nocardioides sp. SLBN-35]